MELREARKMADEKKREKLEDQRAKYYYCSRDRIFPF